MREGHDAATFSCEKRGGNSPIGANEMRAADEERMHGIWDELSTIEASQPEAAAAFLMTALAAMTGARNATWAGAIRVAGAEVDDPLSGWRVAAMQALPAAVAATAIPPEARFREILRHWDRREIDPSFLLPLREVGRFRTYAFRRDLPRAWFASPFYREHYAAAGIHDAVFVAFPLNEDCESHFGFYSERRFSAAEIRRLSSALRGIRWFHYRLMLSYGLLVASAPMTPTERGVLRLLLTDASEKHIAARFGIATSTTHQHILSIYGKFGVRSRAGLMSLWLARAR